MTNSVSITDFNVLRKVQKGGKNVPVPLCIGDKQEINSRIFLPLGTLLPSPRFHSVWGVGYASIMWWEKGMMVKAGRHGFDAGKSITRVMGRDGL